MWERAPCSMHWLAQKPHKPPTSRSVLSVSEPILLPLNTFSFSFSTYFLLSTSKEPNVGLVNVPDTRLAQLGVINKSEKLQPTVVRTD
jgi:hypothetical protein